MPITASEAFVAKLCSRVFLFPGGAEPHKASGKELRDVLVDCDPDVVILCVKKVRLQADVTPDLGAERWRRCAVEASVKILHGAERWLCRGGVVR